MQVTAQADSAFQAGYEGSILCGRPLTRQTVRLARTRPADQAALANTIDLLLHHRIKVVARVCQTLPTRSDLFTKCILGCTILFLIFVG